MFAPPVAKKQTKGPDGRISKKPHELPILASQPAAALSEPRVEYDFSQVPVHSDDHQLQRTPTDHSLPNVPRPLIQTKLTVGSSSDPLEHEADRVADHVMAAPSHSLVTDSPQQIQRAAGDSSAGGFAAPASVDRVLASPGSPLEPALRQQMEQRIGHDFSQVRVHTDSPAAQSARDVNAHAYTTGSAVVFGAGRFAPAASEGRRLLAHELTHVVQQSAGDTRGASIPIQREVAQYGEFLAPDALVEKFKDAMNQNFFEKIGRVLVDAVYSHPTPYQYISEVFEKVHDWDSDVEDNLGAEFISQLPKAKLEQMANAHDGRQTLTVVYEAMITGSVSAFEREQANKVLMAKARAYKPEDYLRQTRMRAGGKRTRIFPIRFMRVTPGYDYATPLAELMPNGTIRVKYPVATQDMDTFKAETATLEGGFFVGKGEEINPNEIVGIKDYERGGGVQYLPAMALLDYSNQAVRSTAGKILEVSIFAATMGAGGAAVGGGVAATEVRMTAIWAARLTRAAAVLDRVANVIGIASFVINENRDWIIRKLGKRGAQLVQIAEAANSIAGIYGVARLAQVGYKIVKEMQSASKAVRMEAGMLTQEENVVLRRLDDETDSLLKQLDAEAAKTGPGKSAAPVEKPTAGPKVETTSGKSVTDTPTKTGPVGSQSRTGYSRNAPRSEADIASKAGGTKRRVGPVDKGKGSRPRYANDPVDPKVKGAPKPKKAAFETDVTKVDPKTLDPQKLKDLGAPTPQRPWHGRLEGAQEFDPRLTATSGGKTISDFDGVENGVLFERKTAQNAGDPTKWVQTQITEKYEKLRQLRAEIAREYPEYKDADIGFRFEGPPPTQELMDAVYEATAALEKKYGANVPVDAF